MQNGIRIWDDTLKKMLYTQPIKCDNGIAFLTDEHLESDHIVIMNSTHVTDFNGVEIYEGDIVKVIEDYTRDDVFEPFIAGEVKFCYGSFYVDDNDITRYDWSRYIYEVIGNIYQNPDLLTR